MQYSYILWLQEWAIPEKIQKGEAEDMEFEKIEKIEYGNSRGQ